MISLKSFITVQTIIVILFKKKGLWENEKSKTMEKKLQILICNESIVTVSYKIKFIDSTRIMASSLSNPVDNIAEGISETKCKDCDCFLQYESVKDNLIKYKCLSCNKYYSSKLDEKFKKPFNTFKFCDNDINKFNLL